VLRYLKSAFFAGVNVPGIGRLPLNALAVAAAGILGFVEPYVWFLGAGLETAFVFTLAFNPRFQKVVDGQFLQLSESRDADQEKKLTHTLRASLSRRYEELGEQCAKAMKLYQAAGADDFVLEANDHALENLKWLYLKLLVAKENLIAHGDEETEENLHQKMVQIERDLAHLPETDTLAKSKAATLDILQRRVDMLHNREKTLQEVDSDLTRIEEQISLIMDNARVQDKPSTIATEIDLATDLAGGSLYGSSEKMIAAMDRKYTQAAPASRSQETA